MAGLVIKPRARLFHGHDWVYASEILKGFGDLVDGSVVSLKDGKDRMLGSAIYNSRSQIVARRFSRHRQDLDIEFFIRRITQAVEIRERRKVDPRACRVVWSESDGLPGLVVDRYGDCLVVQTLTLGMDQRLSLIVQALADILRPACIVERNDAPVRSAEGLELRTGILLGEVPSSIGMECAGVAFSVDPLHGQKTGFYLDQRDNYEAIAGIARGRRVLDCFSNQGAFALAAARNGALAATAVEIGADAVAAGRAAATRNSLQVEFIESNAFDWLKMAERGGAAEFDLVILDPPSFTKTKAKLNDALRGYKEIHLRALKLLAPAGQLATFCCSHHVTADLFQEAINEAVVDARVSVRQLRRFEQAADHPIVPTLPETEYLKGFLFELMPPR